MRIASVIVALALAPPGIVHGQESAKGGNSRASDDEAIARAGMGDRTEVTEAEPGRISIPCAVLDSMMRSSIRHAR
jgi:hypothetical protein